MQRKADPMDNMEIIATMLVALWPIMAGVIICAYRIVKGQ